MNTKTLWIGISAVVVILTGIWLYKVNSQPSQAQMPPSSEQPAKNAYQPTDISSPTPSAGTAPAIQNVKKFTVMGENYTFTPSILTAKKGDRIKITFKNIEGFHDLKIDEFGIATKRINGGSQDVVEFTADKIGSFEYYCSVGQHRAMGMKGTLTIQ